MGRWRPPAKTGSKYITLKGYEKLNSELRYLWKEKRPAVTRSVQEAAAQGDRSENAEYIYGKKQLREIDGRIQFLSRRLDDMTVVDKPPPDQTRIYFGAWVTLITDTEKAARYRIVGPDEIGDHSDYISIDSPMARALIGKQSGDIISINTPGKHKTCRITHIGYQTKNE